MQTVWHTLTAHPYLAVGAAVAVTVALKAKLTPKKPETWSSKVKGGSEGRCAAVYLYLFVVRCFFMGFRTFPIVFRCNALLALTRSAIDEAALPWRCVVATFNCGFYAFMFQFVGPALLAPYDRSCRTPRCGDWLATCFTSMAR